MPMDNTDKQLLVAKLQYVTFYGALAFIMPYYSLYFERLGFSGAQIGLIAALRPWVQAPMASLWGALADRYTVHYGVLQFSYVAGTLTRLCMALPLFTDHGLAPMLVPVLATEVLQAPVGVLVDSAVMATVRKDRDYGVQRMWGTIGWGALSPLAGWVLQRFSGERDLRGAFVCYAAASLVCLVPTAMIDFEPLYAKRRQAGAERGQPSSQAAEGEDLGLGGAADGAGPGGSSNSSSSNRIGGGRGGGGGGAAAMGSDGLSAPLLGGQQQRRQQEEEDGPAAGSSGGGGSGAVRKCSADSHGGSSSSAGGSSGGGGGGMRGVLRNPAAWGFFLLAALMGYGIGNIESYLFLWLQELGASPELMGIDLFVNCAAELPLFLLSARIFRAVRVEAILQATLLAYIARFAWYAALPAMRSVWLVLPIEVLHGVTFALGYSAGTIQAARLAPPALRATMQGIFASLFGGVGYGAGGLVGGLIYHRIGLQATFVIGGFVIAGCWALYGAMQVAVKALGLQPAAAESAELEVEELDI